MHVKSIFPIASVSQAYKINLLLQLIIIIGMHCIPIIIINCVVLVVIFISLTVML